MTTIHLEGPPGTKTKCSMSISGLPIEDSCVSFHNDRDATCPDCIAEWERIHGRKYGRILTMVNRHFLQVCEALSLVDDQAVERTIEILKIVRAAQGTVWIAGNGGSAATASHVANDLTKMGKVKALCVSDFGPTTLAYGNDNGWDKMFSDTLEAHIGPKDAVIGISCSGNSKNIITFLAMARNRYKIGLTGPGSNTMSSMKPAPDVIIRAMADEITVQEDIHSIVCHAIARSLMNV